MLILIRTVSTAANATTLYNANANVSAESDLVLQLAEESPRSAGWLVQRVGVWSELWFVCWAGSGWLEGWVLV